MQNLKKALTTAIMGIALLPLTNHAQTWIKLPGHTNLPPGWRSFPSSVDASRGIIYSVSASGVFWKYDIRSNLFSQLPLSGWPGRADQCVFNPEENTIWLTLNGRGQVFRLPAAGGAVTLVGASGASYEDFSNVTFWNPVTHKMGAAFGYGFSAVRNWRWEFGTNDTGWVQIEANTPGREPWTRTVGSAALDSAGRRLFVSGEIGNSTGVQGQFDIGFSNNGNQFDYLKDLWVLNLQSNQWRRLIPLNTSIAIQGRMVYFPPLDTLFMINGYQIPANANPSVFVTGLWSFVVGQSTNWTQVAATGEVPNASDEGLPAVYSGTTFHDPINNRILHFNSKGVYALNVGPTPHVVSNANYGLITNQQPTFSVATTNGTMHEEFDYIVTGPFDHTTPALQNGNIYKVTISGRVGVGPRDGENNSTPDCCYVYVNWQNLDLVHVAGTAAVGAWDSVSGRRPYPDGYNTNHIYDFYINGTGAGLAFSFRDNPYGDNIGGFHVKIFNLGAPGVITAPPSITSQPVSQTVNEGSPVSFNVIAIGTGLNYQWQFQSVNISGATNTSYNLTSATTNNVGIYAVIVSNPGGSVTSSNAVLAVIPPSCPPHAALATLVEVSGFVVGANLTGGGCGYTNTPRVRIMGGGGTGAQAVAVVSNGVVTAVNVQLAGFGYTNGPIIVISPPFIPQPTMSGRVYLSGPFVTTVLEVELDNLSPYDNYQFELNPGVGGTWSNFGTPFTPTATTGTQYVPASGSYGFLRLKYVP